MGIVMAEKRQLCLVATVFILPAAHPPQRNANGRVPTGRNSIANRGKVQRMRDPIGRANGLPIRKTQRSQPTQ